jgi:RNA polymerase sigma factor (sigma-70 family)
MTRHVGKLRRGARFRAFFVTTPLAGEDPEVTVAELYRRHAPGLYGFALRLTGERTAAEDLVAEAFALAVAGGGPAEPASARAFLFGVVRNLSLHRRRAAARRPEATQEQAEEALAGLAAGGDAEGQAVVRQELAATQADLLALPEEARAALLLRAEGLSHEEIAAVLGTSPGAAKVRVHRARTALAARRAAREGAAP